MGHGHKYIHIRRLQTSIQQKNGEVQAGSDRINADSSTRVRVGSADGRLMAGLKTFSHILPSFVAEISFHVVTIKPPITCNCSVKLHSVVCQRY